MAQSIFAATVRNALAQRRPRTWRELLPGNWRQRNSVVDFAWRRGDRELNDPNLTVTVRILNALAVVSWAAWLLGVGLLPARLSQ
jgi:hypothetical protein